MTNRTPRVDLGMIALLVLLLCGIVAVMRMPALFGGAGWRTEEFRTNRNKIKQMTQAQRDRIRRSSERFHNEMTEEQRREMRTLHEKLQNAPDSNRLKAVLTRYNEWLASLSPYQREELRDDLRNAESTEKKRKIIEDLKEEIERKRDDERILQSVDHRMRRAYERESDPEKKREMMKRFREIYTYRRRPDYRPRFDTEVLDAVVDVIAGQLMWTQQQKAELQTLPRSHQRLRIMLAAMKEHSRRRRDRMPGLLSDDDLKTPIETEIQDPRIRKTLLQEAEDGRGRYSILYRIKNSIYDERRRERSDPTDEQLSAFFQSLSIKKQDELMQRPGREKIDLLERWYFTGGEDGDDFRKFLSEWYGLFRRFGWRSPRGGKRRTGGRRDGESRSRSPR